VVLGTGSDAMRLSWAWPLSSGACTSPSTPAPLLGPAATRFTKPYLAEVSR